LILIQKKQKKLITDGALASNDGIKLYIFD